jgi:CheY-like chemotaxis protein
VRAFYFGESKKIESLLSADRHLFNYVGLAVQYEIIKHHRLTPINVRERILIVEDCFIQSTVVRKMLEGEGFAVVDVCRSGEETLESVQREVPDVVLMDIFINGHMNGIETMKRVRDLYGTIPVIFITALTRSELHEEALSIQPSSLLTKPVSKSDLLTSISELREVSVEA